MNDDPRTYARRAGRTLSHIVRPDAPESWDAIRSMVWVGRRGRGERPAYCGVDTASMLAEHDPMEHEVCSRCLAGYYADEEAD